MVTVMGAEGRSTELRPRELLAALGALAARSRLGARARATASAAAVATIKNMATVPNMSQTNSREGTDGFLETVSSANRQAQIPTGLARASLAFALERRQPVVTGFKERLFENLPCAAPSTSPTAQGGARGLDARPARAAAERTAAAAIGAELVVLSEAYRLPIRPQVWAKFLPARPTRGRRLLSPGSPSSR